MAAGGASTVDLSGTTTGTRDAVRLPGRATEIPHKGDPDSGVAIIAEIGRETVDNAEDAANDSTNGRPCGFGHPGDRFFLAVSLRPAQFCQGDQPHF